MKCCEAPGCFERTSEGKPFCLGHVERNLYAADLAPRNARRWAEEASAIAGDPLVAGELARDVARLLGERGAIPIVKVADQLTVSLPAATRLVEAMVEAGVVEATIEQRPQRRPILRAI